MIFKTFVHIASQEKYGKIILSLVKNLKAMIHDQQEKNEKDLISDTNLDLIIDAFLYVSKNEHIKWTNMDEHGQYNDIITLLFQAIQTLIEGHKNKIMPMNQSKIQKIIEALSNIKQAKIPDFSNMADRYLSEFESFLSGELNCEKSVTKNLELANDDKINE